MKKLLFLPLLIACGTNGYTPAVSGPTRCINSGVVIYTNTISRNGSPRVFYQDTYDKAIANVKKASESPSTDSFSLEYQKAMVDELSTLQALNGCP